MAATKWLTSTTLSTTTTVSKWLLLLTTGCYTSLLLLYSTPLLLLLLYSNPLFTTSKLPDFDLQGSSNHVAAVNYFLAIFLSSMFGKQLLLFLHLFLSMFVKQLLFFLRNLPSPLISFILPMMKLSKSIHYMEYELMIKNL